MGSQKRKKVVFTIIFTLVFSILCAAGEEAQPKETELLPGAVVLLPVKSKVAFDWLAPPVDTEKIKKIEQKNTIFNAGLKGEAWIGSDNQLLMNTKEKFVIKLEIPYSGFTVLDDGSMFIAAGKYLGFIPKLGKKIFKDEDGVIIAPFRPLCRLPAAECRLFKGQDDVFYIAGKNEKNGNEEVYTFGGEGTVKEIGKKRSVLSYKKVFTIDQHISSVAGDGKITYIAMERLIVKVTRGKDKAEFVFAHPAHEITGIAYGKAAGLFYSTDSGIGYIGSNGDMEFIRIPGPMIAVQAGMLYVLLPDTLGILKISNIEDFKTYDLHPKPKSGDKK